MTNFIYFLTGEANNALLKSEIKRKYPLLKPAYSRPGFITYKNLDDNIDISAELDILFCYSYGISIGRGKKGELRAKVQEALDSGVFKSKPILNSFLCEAEYKDIVSAMPGKFKMSDFLPDDPVLEIVKTFDDEFYLGAHVFGVKRTNLNDYFNAVVPSRAYFKIREAVSLVGARLSKGETVLDLGAAPGGASLYFLQNGLEVTGVDPADMDKLVTNNKEFTLLRLPIEKVTKEALVRDHFDWIAIDINLDPLYITHELARILELLKDPPKGLFFTVKLTQKFSQERIPEFLSIIKARGFKKVIARQVPSNKSEFLAYASNV